MNVSFRVSDNRNSSSSDTVTVEVGAQVPLQQLAEVEEISDGQWLVEVVLGPERRDVGGRARTFTAAALRGIPGQDEHHVKMRNEVPMITGIICSNRLIMYLPTFTS